MPKLSWSKMTEAHPAPHVVIGDVSGLGGLQPAARTVERLVDGMGLKGEYALISERNPRGDTVQFAFELREDADRLAKVVRAHAVGPDSGGATQRSFTLDSALQKMIASALADHIVRQALVSPPQGRQAAGSALETDTDEYRWEARLKAVTKPPVKSGNKPE